MLSGKCGEGCGESMSAASVVGKGVRSSSYCASYMR